MAEANLKSQTKRGIHWTFLNQFINYGLQFIVGIIMARLLTPGDYGITALPAVFLAIADVFIDGGFGGALVRKPEVSQKDLSTAFYYAISVGVFFYIVIFFAAPLIANYFETPVLVPLVRVTSLTFLWGPLMTPQNVILKRNLNFKTITRISVTTKIIGSAIGVSLAFLGYGLWSLVAMSVISNLLELIQKWFKVRWLPTERWSKESFKYLWGYGNKMMIAGLLNNVYKSITPIFVGKYFSPADLGIYNRALGYAQLLAHQGTNIIQQVTFPVLSKIQGEDEALARNYRRMLQASAFVIFPIMLMLSALARPLVILLITDKWESCIILLQLLCFAFMWYPIHAINLNLLQVKGRSDLFLKLEVYKIIISVVILFCSLPFGLIYFCIASIFNSMISLFINTYYTGKLINVSYIDQMKDLLPIWLLSFITWGAIHISFLLIELAVHSLLINLIVGSIVGISVYIGFAYLFKMPQLQDVKYMLNIKQ